MSDVRFNNWLHQSGTGGVTQDSSGSVGIGSTLPTAKLDIGGAVKIDAGIVTATTFSGNITGGNITGVAATFTGAVKIGGVLTYEDVTNVDSVGIVTARSGIVVSGGDFKVGSAVTVSQAGVVTATSYSGDGSNLSGITSIKDSGGNVKVQANNSGAILTGILTTGSEGAFISPTAVGVGTTTTTGRDVGVSTSPGTLIYNSTTNELQCWHGTQWVAASVQPFGATGGTKNTSSRSGWAVHTFTGPGTFTVSGQSKTGAEYLIVGGGGGGGRGGVGGTGFEVGAGGAGGHRSFSGHTLSPGSYTVVVGAGGNGAGQGDGVDSSVFGNTSAHGGGGAGHTYGGNTGRPGGSGGGGAGGSTNGTPNAGGPQASGDPGTANTGGGGGGSGFVNVNGGTGGSGIVIIAYPTS